MGAATGCGCKEVYRFPHDLIDSISRDEQDSPRYIITIFKHYHRVLRLISNRISV